VLRSQLGVLERDLNSVTSKGRQHRLDTQQQQQQQQQQHNYCNTRPAAGHQVQQEEGIQGSLHHPQQQHYFPPMHLEQQQPQQPQLQQSSPCLGLAQGNPAAAAAHGAGVAGPVSVKQEGEAAGGMTGTSVFAAVHVLVWVCLRADTSMFRVRPCISAQSLRCKKKHQGKDTSCRFLLQTPGPHALATAHLVPCKSHSALDAIH